MNILIVGRGLAGMALAWNLKRHAGLQVVDGADLPSSTVVATGMYNPVVFRHIRKSWMIDQLLPEMHSFLEDMGRLSGKQLSHAVQFFRKLPNEQYKQLWDKQAREEDFQPYIQHSETGLGQVLKAGIVDCPALIETFREYALKEGWLRDEVFDHSELTFQRGVPCYKQKAFDKIVFCEGPLAAQNPLFSWLPFNICKGEWIIIEIEAEKELQDFVLNNVINIIPVGNKRYKLSSTYSWQDLDWKPTPRARQELLEKFREVYPSVEYRVVDQGAGLRPTVADRRPYLGWHPEHENIGVFNGLGSKGVMLAPYFAKHFAEHIIEGKPLMDEVNISRHYKRHKKPD